MCTSVVEVLRAEGMAKHGDQWFPLSRAVVAYDHARHAPLGDVVTLDFINTDLAPEARAGIELTLETAKELHAALGRAITAAEFEEAEVRGKGALDERLRLPADRLGKPPVQPAGSKLDGSAFRLTSNGRSGLAGALLRTRS